VQEKAITNFNRDNPQGKQIVINLNQTDLETFWRSTMNLTGCGDGKIAHTIITSRWTTTATNDFSNMLENLAIRGKFKLSANKEGRVYLDWKRMSMKKVRQLIQIAIDAMKANAGAGNRLTDQHTAVRTIVKADSVRNSYQNFNVLDIMYGSIGK